MVDLADPLNAEEAQAMLDSFVELREQLRETVEKVAGVREQADGLIKEIQEAYAPLTERLQTILQRADAMRENVATRIPALMQQAQTQLQQIKPVHQHAQDCYAETRLALKTLADNTAQYQEGLQTHLDEKIQASQNLIGKAAELLSDLEQQAMQQAQAVFNQVIEDAPEWSEAFSELTTNATQALGNQLEQRVCDSGQQFVDQLRETAGELDKRLTTSAQQVYEQSQEMLQTFCTTQQGRLDNLSEQATQLKEHLLRVAEQLQNLTHGATEATGTLVAGMDTVNVGLKVTIGTLNNVKSIFEEIRL